MFSHSKSAVKLLGLLGILVVSCFYMTTVDSKSLTSSEQNKSTELNANKVNKLVEEIIDLYEKDDATYSKNGTSESVGRELNKNASKVPDFFQLPEKCRMREVENLFAPHPTTLIYLGYKCVTFKGHLAYGKKPIRVTRRMVMSIRCPLLWRQNAWNIGNHTANHMIAS